MPTINIKIPKEWVDTKKSIPFCTWRAIVEDGLRVAKIAHEEAVKPWEQQQEKDGSPANV